MTEMKKPKMTDKERILFTLFPILVRPNWMGPNTLSKDGPRVESGEPKKNDLVICMSSGLRGAHPYIVGWAVTDHEPTTAHCRVRELGGDRVCDISNESFYIIRGVRRELLFEGAQHLIHQKVLKAFHKLDAYIHRWHSTRFESDTLVIVVREAFAGHHNDGKESVPYEVQMPWSKRTTIKEIVVALKDAGFGTREFERRAS